MTFKELYNKLSRDIAFSGTLIARPKYAVSCYASDYLLGTGYSCVQVRPNQIIIILKTPAPSGGHKIGLGKYFVFLAGGQIVYWTMYSPQQFEQTFEIL